MDETAGRDAGKVFALTEMPCMQAEKWAIRALRALVRSNVDLPPGVMEDFGWAGLGLLSVKALAGMEWGEADALLDEMMPCVKVIRDAQNPHLTFDLIPDVDVQEISTLLRLRVEVFNLHSRPSLPGVRSMLGATTPPRAPGSPGTQTSPPPAPPS